MDRSRLLSHTKTTISCNYLSRGARSCKRSSADLQSLHHGSRRAVTTSSTNRCQLTPRRAIPKMDVITSSSHTRNPWTVASRSYYSGGTPPTTLEQHQQEVDQIVASVKGFYSRQEKFRVYHGSTNSTRKSALGRDPRKVVDTSRLNHVVRVDTETETVLVEPNVPMDRLVEETLKYGLVPPVVMEFPGITAGGGYAGTSGESSSFKHGFFNRTINKVEMVLANGEVVTASDSQHADLFHGAAGALGTLGVTTMVELQLRKATKFIETTYHPVGSMQKAIQKLQEFATSSEYDYIDGIMYSQTCGAIITGQMTNNPRLGLNLQRFSDPHDPWFYLYVKDKITKHIGPTSDAVPLPDYLFRYDRGGFWVGAATFDYLPALPFNDTTRAFLDDFLHTRMLYNALHASGQSEHMIVQDLALPYATATEFVERMDDMLGIWPLWLCPLKQSPGPTMHPHLNEHEADGSLKQMLNIGLWGQLPPKYQGRFVQANRDIESVLQELRGMKWLYAQTYFSEEDFWKDFDKEWYDSLRAKYHAETLPTVYEKVKVDVEGEKRAKQQATMAEKLIDTYPLSGMWGLRKAIESGDYLEARDPAWKHWVPRA